MKKRFISIMIFLLVLTGISTTSRAQCSICTRSAQQLGERPAKALNAGILYLAFAPLAILGILGYRWWKSAESYD